MLGPDDDCGAYSCVPTMLNSLFDGRFICPRPAKPMNHRHFQCRAIGGAIKFPVIFPDSREFGGVSSP